MEIWFRLTTQYTKNIHVWICIGIVNLQKRLYWNSNWSERGEAHVFIPSLYPFCYSSHGNINICISLVPGKLWIVQYIGRLTSIWPRLQRVDEITEFPRIVAFPTINRRREKDRQTGREREVSNAREQLLVNDRAIHVRPLS